MKRIFFITVLSSFMALGFSGGFMLYSQPEAAQESPTAPKEIIRKVDAKMRDADLIAEMNMTVVRPDWTREMSMKMWGKGNDYGLVLITAPARDKGTAFLKRENEMWNWQPTIERSVKLPPSMMGQSWMGSDFTNDDLVQQTSIVDDFEHEILSESDTISGRDCYKIEMIPHEDAAVVWGKLIMWVDKADFLELKTEFYDEDEYLINTTLASDIKEVDGKVIATRIEVLPAEEEGHKTIIVYENVDFDADVPKGFFSLQNMKRVR